MTIKNQKTSKSRLSRLQIVKQGNISTPPEEGRKIVPLTVLVEDPRNERKVYRNMEGLIATVKAVGVIEPLTVKSHDNGKYMVTTGHRRFRAAKEAGLKEITVMVGNDNETVRRRKSVVSNVQREDIGPIELAEGLQALIDEDNTIKTQRDLANVIGKREAWVSDMLRILTIPPKLQKKLRSTEVSIPYDAIMRIARIEDEADQSQLIKAVLGGATQREIREQINTIKGKTDTTPVSATPKKPKEVYHTDYGFSMILQSESEKNISKKKQIAGLEQVLERLKNSSN